MEVRANVAAGAACSIATPGAVDFGDIPNTPAQPITNFEITVTCTNGLFYQIGIDAGQNSTIFAGARAIVSSSGQSAIPYFLVQDDGQTEWGDLGLTNQTYPAPTRTATGTGSPDTFLGIAVLTIDEVIASTLESGIHTDVVSVRVDF